MKRKALLLAAATLAALLGYGLFVRLRPSSPEYAWLVFGPTAKVRVLASVAGDTITLQRFAGDDPAGEKEQFKDLGQPMEFTFADADGVTSYVIRKCSAALTVAEKTPKELFVNVDVNGPVTFRQYSDTTAMARDIETAPISHFHGPLAVGPVTINWEVPSNLALRRGEKGTDLRAFIGTMDAARGCWVVVETHEGETKCLFPDGVRPVADIEFPPKRPGDPPVKRSYVLDQFC